MHAHQLDLRLLLDLIQEPLHSGSGAGQGTGDGVRAQPEASVCPGTCRGRAGREHCLGLTGASIANGNCACSASGLASATAVCCQRLLSLNYIQILSGVVKFIGS